MSTHLGGGWLDLNLASVDTFASTVSAGVGDLVSLGSADRWEVSARPTGVETLANVPILFDGLADLATIVSVFGLGGRVANSGLSEMVGGFTLGESVGSWSVRDGELLGLLASLDPLLVVGELLLVVMLCHVSSALLPMLGHTYSMIVGACAANGISAYEVGGILTSLVGLVLFDLFITATEEDLADMASALILCFVGWSLALVTLGLGVSFYYSLSPVSGGSVGLRVVLTDVTSVALCLLRVVFCWVRYIFYDLQVELVDLSLHYTDEVGAPSFGGWGLHAPLALLVGVQWDLTLVIVQVLLSVFKLAIASFLLWLIVDLFVLRPMAWSESRWAA